MKQEIAPGHHDPEMRAVLARRLLTGWLKRSPGAELVAAERYELDRVLPDLFGYHLLQLGGHRGRDFCAASRTLHQTILEGPGAVPTDEIDIYADPSALPVETGSVDVAVLPHTLDLENDPWAILAEMERILIPEGHIVILGINPWSSWGIYRFLQVIGGDPLWNRAFLSVTRLTQWLDELGFQIEQEHGFFYRPPIHDPRWMERLAVLEEAARAGLPLPAGIYLLVAVKRVTTLTPIRPAWRRRLAAPAVGRLKPIGTGS